MGLTPPKHIRNLESYTVTSQDVWKHKDNNSSLKLDWNESTVVNKIVQKRLIEFFRSYGSINWYPDVEARSLTKKISKFLDCSPMQVLVFGGSDVALDSIARTFLTIGDNVSLVHPSYDNFRVYAESCGAQVLKINGIVKDGLFDIGQFIDELTNISRLRMIYLINPNNPIGYLIPKDSITKILNTFPNTAVVIDEAYIEFAGMSNSSANLVNEYDNLLVCRSFSKAFGIAGLRLGYVVSNQKNLNYLKKVRNGKNVSMSAQIAGETLLDNLDEVKKHIIKINDSKEWFSNQLNSLGINYLDGHANFVLVKVKKPQEVLINLKRNGIFIRDRSYIEGLDNYLRITIGYREQMQKVLKVLKESPELWKL